MIRNAIQAISLQKSGRYIALVLTAHFAVACSNETVAVQEAEPEALEGVAARVLGETPAPVLKSDKRGAFVQVKGMELMLGDKPYHYIGTNFWQAMNLASRGPGGNRAQLLRELDALRDAGVTNLRILCASEGPDTEPLRVVPSLMKAPGVYDPDLLDALDFLLSEMGARGMKAVMVLGNMWHWSGGFGQYLVWAGAGREIPYPPPRAGGDWDDYQEFVFDFYGNKRAVRYYLENVKYLVTRRNSYTDVLYTQDPAIMSWELANEPRGGGNTAQYHKWIDVTSSFIKALDGNHLVTTGSEGNTSKPYAAGTDYEKDHNFPNIDYGTAHVWIQNWGWYDPKDPYETYDPAATHAMEYLDSHALQTVILHKPLVVEEFGIARDRNSFNPRSSTRWRDEYYEKVFEHIYHLAGQNVGVSGANFWAWAGESRPVRPYGLWWEAGDPLLGDPPHEQQGWYSIYDTDVSTLRIISKYAREMSELGTTNP